MVKNKFYEGPKRSEEVRHFFFGFNTTQACDPQFILRRGQTPAPGEQAKSMSRRRTELAGANVCAPHRKTYITVKSLLSVFTVTHKQVG